MSVVKVTSAYKVYESKSELKTVLSSFNMKVQKGTIYSLMGASGCGKTTLMSALIGNLGLDRGRIEVFGEEPGKNKSLIGYMPQETALVEAFKIREMIWFYGTIYGLPSYKIYEKFQFLSELLELPNEDQFIKECSGGQKRRVSFAVSLLHDPELLILDEPTVGVDPLLRSKIWDHLVELTRKQNVTVLLSTHYTEEAKQSTHVGLMRNGVLIAEGTPQNLMIRTETDHLDDAFLMLSKWQDSAESGKEDSSKHHEAELENNSRERPKLRSRKSVSYEMKKPKPIKALLKKNFLEMLRSTDIIAAIVVLPIFLVTALYYGVGGKIEGLQIGIVDEEIGFAGECSNRTLLSVDLQDFTCTFNKSSCRFLNEINDSDLQKIFYSSRSEAHDAVKSGNNVGYIWFASNFTESISLFNDDPDFESHDNGFVQVFLDKSDLQKSSIVERKLFDAYEKFIENVMVDCGKSYKAGKLIVHPEAIVGKMDYDFRPTLIPAFVLPSHFAFATSLTAMSIVSERANGSWNRVLASGVKPYQILIAQLLIGIFMSLFQFCEILILLVISFKSFATVEWSFLIISGTILFLNGLVGLLFGLLSSIKTKTMLGAVIFTQYFPYPMTFISGVIWPVEGMPKGLQLLGQLFPFAGSAVTLRRLFAGDMEITDSRILASVSVQLTWIVLLGALSFWCIREKQHKKVEM